MTSKDAGDIGARSGAPYERLAALGLSLPVPLPPMANFVPALIRGSTVFLSGQGPIDSTGIVHRGKVGSQISVEEAYSAARLTTLNLLAALESVTSSLSKVRQIVKVFGMVNAEPDFMAHPAVINGCSDLLVQVFGESIGRHARSAIGVGSLPGQIAVEIEMIAEIDLD